MVELNVNHTAEYLGKILLEILANQGLYKYSVVTVVTDNETNI
jgi:hypothetical protein